jgi:predicted RecB family nuclease
MQLIDGQPVYSATDLVGYLACEHLTVLERAALAGLVPVPKRRDRELEIIQKRGLEHEQRYLQESRADGRRIVEIQADLRIADHGERLRQEAAATRAAMAEGADVVYQAAFFDGSRVGRADFLLRVDNPGEASCFGPYYYEVADTKLARHVKASALLQICWYSDQLERVQGVRPGRMHVVLGGNPLRTETFRLDDFSAYYRRVRSRFEAAVAPTAPYPSYPLPIAPDPVEHCEVCRWAGDCDARRRQDDHLSLVANVTRGQRRELSERGVSTLAALARLSLPLDPPPERTSRSSLERVREQARIQAEGRESGRILHELLLPIEPNKGLASLPPPSPGDLFLDLEGDPYALDDGLDYLFGILEPSGTDADGQPLFHHFWSTDPDGAFSLSGEKAAFETTMDLIMERLQADPSLHVYHYAPYEPTAFKRLMGRYGTREDEVDRLLRGGVFVDLYRVVRQGLRASVESYSIKRLEPLYGHEREVPLRDATSSIVEFETWLQLGEGERPGADNLDRILRYNRDDVLSTWRLRDWLEERRTELLAKGQDVPRPRIADSAPSEELAENLRRTAVLAAKLARDVPVEPDERDPEQQGRWLLAQLLSWHRREEKSTWWLFFHLMNELTDDERIEAKEPIGGLEFTRIVDETPRSRIYRYRFPVQEHSVEVGTQVHNPGTGKPTGTVVAIDEAQRMIDLRRGKAAEKIHHPTSIVPLDHVNSRVLQESLLELGAWVAEHGIDACGPEPPVTSCSACRLGRGYSTEMCCEGPANR